MEEKKEFIELIAEYCEVPADEITDEMRFREDLAFTSLGFMALLGELEDAFDIELEEEDALNVTTVGEAYKMLMNLK